MGDLSNHGIIIQLKWSIHPELQNGMYAGSPSDECVKPVVVEVKCQDRALAKAKVAAIINELRSHQNVNN